jgi:hypothetical protein
MYKNNNVLRNNSLADIWWCAIIYGTYFNGLLNNFYRALWLCELVVNSKS